MRLTLWTNNEKIAGSISTEVIVLLKLLEHFIFYHYISHGLEDTSTVDRILFHLSVARSAYMSVNAIAKKVPSLHTCSQLC